MNRITVFTPTYNRRHTIIRTYESLCRQTSSNFNWLIIDDGSSDNTLGWVESLGTKIESTGVAFDWMGCRLGTIDSNHFVLQAQTINEKLFTIEYIYKPNGGLFTGYNVAYSLIQTELCVCIDSDDYMPDNAIERILDIWNGTRARLGAIDFGGIVGLDFNVVDKLPIGGFFPEHVDYAFFQDLHHRGDTKQVMRTELMRQVAPQIGFMGEKDFNPFYMLMQVCDKYPLIVANENFCWVEYQTSGDSMSAGIWRQYIRSPRSYAKYRIMQLQMKHGNSLKSKMKLYIHYISACILSEDKQWLSKAPCKSVAMLFYPLGWLLSKVVRLKNRK